MGFNLQRFIDLLLFPLYDQRSKLTTYLRNQQVKAGFRREPSTKPVMLIAGIIAGVFLFVLLLWIFINSTPSVEKNENTIIQPPLNNQQEIPKEDSTATKAAETYKEALKEVDLAKENEEKVEKNEMEVSDEVEIRKEKKEDGDVLDEAYMRVSASNVNIRTKPSLEADIIARLEQGYMIKKLDSEGDWIFVDPGEDFKGWIYYDLLENVTADEYESWRNNSNQPALIELLRKDLDNPDNLRAEKKKIEKLLRSWKAAWEEKDIGKYMSFYSKTFTKSDYNREGYRKYKKNVFGRSGIISIEIKNIQVDWDNFLMIVSFTQKYQSGTINSTTGKLLHFQQENESWKIVRESLINRD